MVIPLKIFLYIYFAFIVFWLIMCVVAIYHMFKFGFKNFTTFLSTFIFVVVTLLLLSSSYYYISQIDWEFNISIMEGFLNFTPDFTSPLE